MMNETRENLSDVDAGILAERVNYRCSNPDCRSYTPGPDTFKYKSLVAGTPVRISPDGNDNKNVENFVWLCSKCVDHDKTLTANQLMEWKSSAEAFAFKELCNGGVKALPKTVHNIPHTRNLFFTGRKTVIQKLSAKLAEGERVALIQPAGGMGKTGLAVEYVYANSGDYSIIWWIESETESQLDEGFKGLAEEIGIAGVGGLKSKEITRAVLQWLSEHGDWLLVFDNAEKPEDLAGYLPPVEKGAVIITSRNPAFATKATRVSVEPLTLDESVEYLVARTGRMGDEKIARLLAGELSGLPLALELAGVYISCEGTGFDTYLELYRGNWIKIMEHDEPGDFRKTIATVWLTSFKRAQKESDVVADIMNLFAFFHSENIPEWMLTICADLMPKKLAAAIRDGSRFGGAIEPLTRLALIHVCATEEERRFSVHPMVQTVTLDWMKKSRVKYAKNAVLMMEKVFTYNQNNFTARPIYASLLPHVISVATHAKRLNVSYDKAWILFNRAARFMLTRGEVGEAKHLLTKALAVAESEYGRDHENVANCLNSLGSLLLSEGDHHGAEIYFRRALKIVTSLFNEESPLIAILLNNLGLTLQATGDLDGAKKNYQLALQVDRRVYGENHALVAIRLNNLGSILKAEGDLDGAKKNYTRALAIDTGVYGAEHPKIAIRLNNLAFVLKAQGDLDGARVEYRRALEIDRKVFGKDHPKVAVRLNNLGSVLKAQGDLEGARECASSALDIYRKRHGENHPSAKLVLNNLTILESMIKEGEPSSL